MRHAKSYLLHELKIGNICSNTKKILYLPQNKTHKWIPAKTFNQLLKSPVDIK